MPSDRLGVAILGCGRMGQRHAQAVAHSAAFRLVAVADREAAVARTLGEREGVAACTDVAALCAAPDVALVVVAVPTSCHAESVRTALAAGKHVLCEKPLSTSAAEVEDLCARAERAGRLLAVNYPYRHAPAFRRLRALLAAGVLGAPHLALFRIGGRGGHQRWKHAAASGGGAILEMMSHMVDLAVWLFGPPRDAALLTRATLLPQRRIAGAIELVDAEDYAVAELRYDGLRCLIEADLASPSFAQHVEVQSADGAFVGSLVDDVPTRLYLGTARGAQPAGWSALEEPHPQPLDEQWRSLGEALRDGAYGHWRDESRAVAAVLDRLRSQP